MSAYKVLPFDTKQGHVAGHEIMAHMPVQQVVFRTFDSELGVAVEIAVHWTEWTKYMRRSWPGGGECCAVILQDGRRIHASARYAKHYNTAAYLAAPIIARDQIAVWSMAGDRILEIVGMNDYLWSDRSPAAVAKHLPCPWERDNKLLAEKQK